jgi:hypothetical protein
MKITQISGFKHWNESIYIFLNIKTLYLSKSSNCAWLSCDIHAQTKSFSVFSHIQFKEAFYLKKNWIEIENNERFYIQNLIDRFDTKRILYYICITIK